MTCKRSGLLICLASFWSLRINLVPTPASRCAGNKAIEMLLSFVLERKEFADASFVPSEAAQIVAAAALVKFQKERFI